MGKVSDGRVTVSIQRSQTKFMILWVEEQAVFLVQGRPRRKCGKKLEGRASRYSDPS